MLPFVLIAAVVGGGAFYFRDRPGGLMSLFSPSRLDVDQELATVLEARFDENYQPAEGLGLFKERWWTTKHLVRTMPNEVVAYDLASGKVAWKVDVPRNHYCRASGQQSAKGYVAVLSGTREDGCRKLTIVDINNGKVVWTKDLPPADPGRGKNALVTDFPRADHRPVVHGERVYVPTDKGGHILNVADGSVVQSPNPKNKCFTTHYDAIGEVGLAYRNCSHTGDEGRHLTGFDPAGKVIWRWNLPEERGKTYKLVGVLSNDPLLVRVFGEYGRKEIWRVKPGKPDGTGGEHVVVADVSENKKALAPQDPCEIAGSDGLYDCSRAAVADGTLYLPQRKGSQSNDIRHGMAAYDIETGKQLWYSEWDMSHNITAPLGLDDAGHPIAYLFPTEEDPAALVRVDSKTGAMTPVAKLPPPNESLSKLGQRGLAEAPEAGNVEWHNGYLAFFRTQAGEREAGYGATVVYK
ncbi:hypothetical protein GCM10027569_33910 [Flindersiella endophytica]